MINEIRDNLGDFEIIDGLEEKLALCRQSMEEVDLKLRREKLSPEGRYGGMVERLLSQLQLHTSASCHPAAGLSKVILLCMLFLELLFLYWTFISPFIPSSSFHQSIT
uniref:Coiled-coil domain-containing protein 167 n=1 Tax=Anas platyrhynchos TaxID=8839 RepID=A0A8B9SUV1_ANAPL